MAISTISLGKVKFNWKGDWATSTAYVKDDVVKYGPNVYTCITAHTSQSTFSPDSAKWELMVAGLENAGAWGSGTLYKYGQVVTYGGAVYVALQESTNQNPYTQTAYWQRFVDGQQFEGTFNAATNYQKGDIVFYGGYLYVAKQNTLANTPTNTTYWDVYVKGLEYSGTYDPATQYKPGNVVFYGGNTYVVKQGQTPQGVLPTNASSWEQTNAGLNWRSTYSNISEYAPRDLVKYGGKVYICTSEVTGETPDVSGDFQLFVDGFSWKGNWTDGTEYVVGDIVKHGAKLYICTAFTNSNAPDVNVNFTLYTDGIRWVGDYSASSNYIEGDIVNYGARVYICNSSYDNDGSTVTEPPNSDFWTLLIEGMKWQGTYSAVTEYEYGDVVEYNQSSYICVDNDVLAVTPGSNPAKWNLVAQGDTNAVHTTRGDIAYRDSTQVVRLPIGPAGSFLYSDGNEPKWGHLVPQNDYFVSPQGDDTNDGRTPNTSWKTIKHAAEQTFSIGQCRINVQAGTYEEQCPIKIGRSVVVEGNGLGAVTLSPNTTDDNGFGAGISDDGSTPNANSEVFQMNNGARLRNFVFRGFGAGSVQVALDPGYGPDDTSVWITSQSPYVQNCTNFSPGGTGFKIDGALHNGGYKSMVANDFTQINSDGVGIHVLNDGRTEIVSCFTYYCNNGYLAESGGKIRAIVGNNSYGEYGAVARGYSQNETPLTGKLRLNDTTIDSVTQLGSDVHIFTSYRDSVGNRFFVGHTNPTDVDVTSTWSNSSSYPFIAKFNSAGSLDWIYTYESSFGAIHSAVELSDRIYCGGVIYDGSNKGFILSISKAGEIQWQKTVGDTTEIVDVTTDDNNLYAVGTHSTTGTAVIKLNPAGVEQWSRTLEYNDSAAANTLVATSCTFAGTPTTSTDTYALAGDATAEDNLYVSAYDSTANQALITRITSTGGYVATYQYGDVRINKLRLDTGNGDGIYLMAAGYYDAGAVNKNPLLFRLSVDGTVQWQSQFANGSEEGEFKDVLPFGDDIYACGYINESTNNNHNGFLTRFSSAGVDQWTYQLDNGANNVAFNGVMLDGVNVIAAGSEQVNSVIMNVQRDVSDDIGTVTSGSYTFTTSIGSYTSSTVVTRGINEIDQTTLVLGLTDEALTLNQTPTQTRTVVATRDGFSGIGTGVQFTIDSLNRQPKDGSVFQINGDSETYFVIGVANYLAPTVTTGNNPNAQAILTANKLFLQEEVIGWIDAQILTGAGIWSGFTYNDTLCKRDVGLIVDALISDLDESTNASSVDAAIEYFSNASGLTAITDQKDQTLAAIAYLKGIVDNVLNQTAPPSTYSGVSQTTGLSATEAGTVLLTEANVQAIYDTIDVGLDSAPSKTNYGTCTISIDPPIPSNKTPNDGTHVTFREAFSQVRMSGHDFLDIGTGGFADTNYPVIIASDYTQPPDQTREVLSEDGGRVFYVTTDQDGNFRVGNYFKVEQATGRATLSSEEFDLAGLNELQLGSITAGKQGATINEFSTDGTFADNSDTSVPTEKATKTYVDTQIATLSATQGTIVAGTAPAQSKVEVTGTGISTDSIDVDIAGTEVFTIDNSGFTVTPNGTEILDVDASTGISFSQGGNEVLTVTNTGISIKPSGTEQFVANTTDLTYKSGGSTVFNADNTSLQVSPGGTLSFEAAEQFMLVPKGSEANRPGSPSSGYLRFNTDTATFEGYDGTQWSGIGGGNPWITKVNTDTGFTASNNDRIFADTSSGVLTINLPSSPNVGDQVKFVDLAGSFNTNNLTVGRNGENIMGDSSNMVVDEQYAAFTLIYSGATYGWVLGEN